MYPVVEELDDDFFACFNFCDSLFEEPDVQGVQISLWISVEAKDDLTPFLIRLDSQKFLQIDNDDIEKSRKIKYARNRFLYCSNYITKKPIS